MYNNSLVEMTLMPQSGIISDVAKDAIDKTNEYLSQSRLSYVMFGRMKTSLLYDFLLLKSHELREHMRRQVFPYLNDSQDLRSLVVLVNTIYTSVKQERDDFGQCEFAAALFDRKVTAAVVERLGSSLGH